MCYKFVQNNDSREFTTIALKQSSLLQCDKKIEFTTIMSNKFNFFMC